MKQHHSPFHRIAHAMKVPESIVKAAWDKVKGGVKIK